jgi:hypothetical protein
MRPGLVMLVDVGSQQDPQAPSPSDAGQRDELVIVSWPACAAIAVVLVALFLALHNL